MPLRGRALAPIISTRILGRRTAPFLPFLIPQPRPAWFNTKILVLTTIAPAWQSACAAATGDNVSLCTDAHYLYPHLKQPLFIRENQYARPLSRLVLYEFRDLVP